nr:hypothetical protein [Tanacetum cinerariifolium]
FAPAVLDIPNNNNGWIEEEPEEDPKIEEGEEEKEEMDIEDEMDDPEIIDPYEIEEGELPPPPADSDTSSDSEPEVEAKDEDGDEATERLKKKLRVSQQKKEQIEQAFRHVIDWIRKQFEMEIPPCMGDNDATTPDDAHP